MSDINNHPLLVTINQDLETRLQAFADKWRNQCGKPPHTFSKMIETLRNSAKLQISNRINAALTAQSKNAQILEFQNHFIKFEDEYFSPELCGGALEKAHFQEEVRTDALQLLKDFTVFAGGVAIAHFGLPLVTDSSPQESNQADTKATVSGVNTQTSATWLEEKRQDIVSQLNTKGSVVDLNTFIRKTLTQERLSIANAIRRPQTARYETKHLLAFQVFIDEQIQIATDKRDQLEITETIASLTGVATLESYRDRTLQARLAKINDELQAMANSGQPPVSRAIEMKDFLEASIQQATEKIATLRSGVRPVAKAVVATPVAPTVPATPEEPIPAQKPVVSTPPVNIPVLQEEEIESFISKATNATALTKYKQDMLVRPLSVLLQDIRRQSLAGEQISDADMQRKEMLTQQIFRANDKIRALNALPVLTNEETSEIAPPPSNVIPLRPTKETTKWYKNPLAAAASVVAFVAATAFGLGFLNSDTIAKSPVASSPAPQALAVAFHAATTTPVVLAENKLAQVPNIEPTALMTEEMRPLPELPKLTKIKVSFKQTANDNYKYSPATVATVDGIALQRATADTVANVCKTGIQTWICPNQTMPVAQLN